MKRPYAGKEHQPQKIVRVGQGPRPAALNIHIPPGGAQRRQGYGGVARAQGAAVVGEMKYFDCERDADPIAACTTTWVAGTMQDPDTTINLGSAAVANPLCLFAPTVGAALNQRIGRKVKVLKIKLHGLMHFSTAAGTNAPKNGTAIRMMLVQDCQTNAAQMTGAQLMNDAASPSSTLMSFQNPNNFGRFKVLKEKRYILDDPNITGTVAGADIVFNGKKLNWKLTATFKTPIDVHFNATNGGTVADIVDNSFHIVCAADTVTYTPLITYYSRVCYKE